MAHPITDRLLQYNYLPNQRTRGDELPPVFESKTFTRSVALSFAGLGETTPKPGHDAVEYKLTRHDGQTRTLHIPHPAAYARLVLTLEKHWHLLPDLFNNKSSYIKPRFHRDGRLFMMNYSSWITKTLGGLKLRLTSKFVAKADISSFYSSIYTHSIPWALVGLQTAKRSDRRQWFDEIDQAFQAAKRKETNGVAIGPGTSNIAGEIILYRIDEYLRNKGYKFYRYVDDYTAFSENQQSAELFIHDLSQQLAKYKLSLNMKKTVTGTLPQTEKEHWVIELQAAAATLPRTMSPSQVSQLIDQTILIAQKFKAQGAYKYAASILEARVRPGNSSITAFVALMGLCEHAPSLISSLRHFLPTASQLATHNVLDPYLALLENSIFFRRTDGVCWLLYYMGTLGVMIPSTIASKIVDSRDCLPILLLYAYGDSTAKKAVVAFAQKAISAPDMHDRHAYWMLIYELHRIGALKKPGAEKQQFDMMKAAGVKFCTSI